MTFCALWNKIYIRTKGEYSMKNRVAALIALTVSVTVLSLSACAPVDKDYGVQSSEPVQVHKRRKKLPKMFAAPP